MNIFSFSRYFSRYFKILFSHYLGKPVFSPNVVSIIISGGCNLKCQMCDFWKDNENGLALSKENYKVFLKDIAGYGVKKVQFTGGEPLLNKDIYELSYEAKNYGLSTMLVTNGTLITEDNAGFIVKALDTVYISVDSPIDKQHDVVRGRQGAFEKTIRGIDLLVKMKEKEARNTKIIITSTITPESIHDPGDMFRLGRRLGVNWVIYNPASSVNYGNTHLKSGFSSKEALLGEYNNMVDNIIRTVEESQGFIRSNIFYLECSKDFLKGDRRFIFIPCYGGGYDGPILSLKGEIFPCCAWNESIGNILEEPFSKIWNSKKAEKIRRDIKAKKCPMCHHHTRTFDYMMKAPFLIKDVKKLIKGYKRIGSF